MTATQQTESAERIARPLIQLAKLNGISTSYIDQLGTYVEIRDEVLVSVLAALGVDASSDEAIAASYELTKQRIADTLVEPTIVKFIGKEATTPIRAKGHDVTLRLLLEDGTRYEGNLCMYLAPQTDGSLTLTLPDDIPAGYHTLRVNAGPLHGEARLICAPARVPLPPAVAEKQRWGWMAQMYSIRSAESWGVGDYGDLKLLLTDAAEKSHADFMLINPIHATAPVEPLEPSPYLPESRRFMNVTYIRPQDIEEYAGLDEAALAEVERLHAEVAPANDNADELDINSAWWHKRQALQLVFKVPRSAERQAAFEAFKEAAGPDLRAFAAWSVAFQMWGAPWEGTWFAETNRDSPEVAELMRDHADMVEFECWLQWIADEQVTAAQTAARESGMALGSCKTWPWACTRWAPTCGGIRNASPSAASPLAARRTSTTSRARTGASRRSIRTISPKPVMACTAKWCTTCSRTRARCASTMCSACSACGGFRRAKAHAAAHTSPTTMRR